MKKIQKLDTFANLATSQVISRIIQISRKREKCVGSWKYDETGKNEIVLCPFCKIVRISPVSYLASKIGRTIGSCLNCHIKAY